MKKGIVSILFTIIFFLSGCEFSENNLNAEKILSSPPYSELTDSIERFPRNADLYMQRGLLLSQHNQLELANADFKRAWELRPDEGATLEYISNLLLIDKVDEAIRLLKKSIETFPNNTEFKRRLSEVLAQSGRHKEALEQYNEMLKSDSMDFEAWLEKGLLLAQLKDTNAAIKALEKSFSIQPINYSGLALANLYASVKDPRAIAICNFLIERDTAKIQTDAIFIKGVYFSENKKYAEALAQFDECIRRDWKMIDAYLEKGIVLYEQKKYLQALDVFSMAATISNTNADAYFWIGRCYEATGKRQEAIENYERAIALDRHFPEARERLRRIRN